VNIFLVPSWYPSSVNPISGVFIKEQAEALAELAPELRIFVSTWGHEDGYIPFRNLGGSFRSLSWRVRQRGRAVRRGPRLLEFFEPTVSWSGRLPFGGPKGLLKANRRNLRAAIRAAGPMDVIHAHVCYPAGYVASQLSEEFGIPFVLTEHMGPFPFPGLLRDGRPLPEIDRALATASALVAVSPFLADGMASCGYPQPIVVPNLVNESVFVPGPPRLDKFVFLTVCGLDDSKGVHHLIEAIARWDPPAHRFLFRIGGGGAAGDRYRAQAERLGVADRLEWLGPVSRSLAPQLFRDCHAFVMPSLHETFGSVYAEALASGKPVIATRCGGPEYIVNALNGYLVDVGDIDGLVTALERMASRWDAFDPMAIRDDFMARFSRGAVVGRLVDIYRSVIRSR